MKDAFTTNVNGFTENNDDVEDEADSNINVKPMNDYDAKNEMLKSNRVIENETELDNILNNSEKKSVQVSKLTRKTVQYNEDNQGVDNEGNNNKTQNNQNKQTNTDNSQKENNNTKQRVNNQDNQTDQDDNSNQYDNNNQMDSLVDNEQDQMKTRNENNHNFKNLRKIR